MMKPRFSDMVYRAFRSKNARAKILEELFNVSHDLSAEAQLELAHDLLKDIHECIAQLQEKLFEAKASKKEHGRTEREIDQFNREHLGFEPTTGNGAEDEAAARANKR